MNPAIKQAIEESASNEGRRVSIDCKAVGISRDDAWEELNQARDWISDENPMEFGGRDAQGRDWVVAL